MHPIHECLPLPSVYIGVRGRGIFLAEASVGRSKRAFSTTHLAAHIGSPVQCDIIWLSAARVGNVAQLKSLA